MRKPLFSGKCLTVLSLILFPILSFAQQLISGKVVATAGQQPLSGISVSVKGSSSGTSTNAGGIFAINAKQGDVLVFSGISIKTKEITVTGSQVLAELETDATGMNEVVVTALGVRKETKRLTYAIQDVKTSELNKAREPNAVNSLKGKVAGLTVNIGSELLRQPGINFRGEGAILFVVDGIPITTDTWNISPDDIESYTFLKGQAASALYGSLARNGAIVINTRKGTKDKRGFAIEFNSSTMFDKGFLALPKYQDDYGPGSKGKYAFGDGRGGGLNDNDYDVWGPKFEGQLIPQYDGAYDPAKTYETKFADGTIFKGNIAPTPWTARGKDNLKEFLQTGILSTNHISIASRGDKYDLRFGLGHNFQRSIIPNMSVNTTNFNFNAGYQFTDKIKLSANINYSRQYSPNFPDVDYGPNSLIYNVIIWAGADWSMKDMRNYWQPGKEGIQQKYAEYQRYNNPWFVVYEWLRPHYKNDVYGYVTLNWKFAKDFELMYRPSISTYNVFRQEKMPVSAGAYDRDERLGDYREDNRNFFEANNEVQVRYSNEFMNKFFNLDAFAGANIRTARYNGSIATTDYLSVPGLYTLANTLRPARSASIALENLMLSTFYSLDLGVGNFLNLHSTGRLDKVSTLRKDENTYFYPSVGVSTTVSDYTQMPSAVSFLKFRGSYAEGRNAGIYANIGQPAIGFGTGQSYGQEYKTPINMGTYDLLYNGYQIQNGNYNNAPGVSYANGLLDPNLQADNKKTLELGMDIRFMKNRLNLDVTWFNSKSELLSNRNDIISPTSGYEFIKTNYGSYRNRGWEITLSGSPVQNKNFNWNVNVNWSTFVRTWIKHPTPDQWSKDGDRVDLYYGEGFIRTPDGQLVHGSDGLLMRFRDAGQGDAKRIFGHADPDWTWGVNNSFSYKSFRFSFQFDGVVGGVLHDYVRQKTLQGGRHIETSTGLWGQHRPDDVKGGSLVAPGITLVGAIQLDPVTGEITNMKDLQQKANTTATTVQNYSSRYANIAELNIISKTFAKLREITFTYTLPQNMLGKSFIKKAEVSLVGRNLALFFPSKYKDVDPDQFTQSSGSDLQTPSTRRFGFNLNLTF
ncbi:MAG: SusC/RagA family TonB-linked outer membrane protein [Pseudobacter sp.]|uniref:SusC/RagA family TonB-linked outer membrane protein n=1 Tax=Pseudobacter sp. TaxID=2045420 RepID=UPI003F808F2F